MCVFAAPAAAGAAKAAAAPLISKAGIAGLGATASNLFLAQLALTGVTAFAQQQQTASIARQQAKYQYQAAERAAISADRAFTNQQEALAARLREEQKATAQEKFKVAQKRVQAEGAIRATERSGLTIDLLLADANRQELNWKDALNQTLDSATQQYRRDTMGAEAQRDSRRNQSIDLGNQAFTTASKAPTLLDAISTTAASGLSSYIGLRNKA